MRYICKKCGNYRKFKEINVVTTHLLFNGTKVHSEDHFERCEGVSCSECGASSVDGMIEVVQAEIID